MSSDLLKELIDSIELDSIKNDDLQILGDILEESICNNASVLSMLLNNNLKITIKNIEEYSDINQAIEREKKLKKWRREKKEWLIKTLNPDLMDLGKNITK